MDVFSVVLESNCGIFRMRHQIWACLSTLA